jgi:hypothetical protein
MQNPNKKFDENKQMEEENIFPMTTNEQAKQSLFANDHAYAQYDFVKNAGMPSSKSTTTQA